MATRFSIEAVFKAVDRMTAPITRIQNRLRKFTRMASNGFRRLNRTVDRTIAKLKRASLAVIGVATSFGFALAKISKPGVEFGRSIGTAAIKFGEGIERNSDQFKALEKSARDVGRTTEFTSTQAAEGLRLFAQAGFSSKQAMGSLNDTVNFATANVVSLEDATSFATSALGQFGLGSEKAKENQAGMVKVMDVMTKAANSGNLSLTDLSETLKFAGSVAKTTGSNIEFAGAATAFLANRGIRGTSAGTALKNMFLSLAGQAFKSGKVLRKFGIATAESNGDLRNQADVLNDLRESLSKLTEKQRIAAIEQIFGKIALPAASALLSDTTGELDGLIKKMEAAEGTTGKFAGFIRGDVKGSLDTLISSIESVAISIFKINETSFKELLESMTKWVRANEEVIATNIGEFLLKVGRNIGTIVEWIKNIAKGLAVFFTFSIVIKALTAAFVLFNIVTAANSIGLIIVSVAALIAGIVALIFWWDEIKKAFLDIAFIKGVIKAFKAFKKILSGLFDIFVELPLGFQIAIAAMFGPIGLLGLAALKIKENWEPIKAFWADLWGKMQRDVELGVFAMKVAFNLGVNAFMDKLLELPIRVKLVISRVLVLFLDMRNKINSALKGIFDFNGFGLAEKLGLDPKGLQKVSEGFTDLKNAFKETPQVTRAPSPQVQQQDFGPLGSALDPAALQGAIRGEAAPNVIPFNRPSPLERTEVTIKAEAGTEVTNVKGATTRTGVKVINSGGG